MPRIQVPLGDRSYEVLIGPRLLPSLGERCRKLNLGRRCLVVTDENVKKIAAKTAKKSLRDAGFEVTVHSIPPGEGSKNLKQLQLGYRQMAELQLERGSFVVALGGGVVGDLAGFLAASYLRGIDLVQIPTTLLAQVDSSVGGKTGINLKAGKNLVGAFHQPRLVLCDLDLLATLPPREFRAGMAEVVKYGIIRDARLFALLEKKYSQILNQESKPLAQVIAQSCRIKAEVVTQDEQEQGLRAILNYGHTIGHALEAITGYGKYLHGEAISIGQVAAAALSETILGLEPQASERIRNLLAAIGLPIYASLNARQITRLLEAMLLDKKVSDKKIRFVLADRIGNVLTGQNVPSALIRSTLVAGSRHASRK